jgi:hypothetical protein
MGARHVAAHVGKFENWFASHDLRIPNDAVLIVHGDHFSVMSILSNGLLTAAPRKSSPCLRAPPLGGPPSRRTFTTAR